jgi:hypothetical protein
MLSPTLRLSLGLTLSQSPLPHTLTTPSLLPLLLLYPLTPSLLPLLLLYLSFLSRVSLASRSQSHTL